MKRQGDRAPIGESALLARRRSVDKAIFPTLAAIGNAGSADARQRTRQAVGIARQLHSHRIRRIAPVAPDQRERRTEKQGGPQKQHQPQDDADQDERQQRCEQQKSNPAPGDHAPDLFDVGHRLGVHAALHRLQCLRDHLGRPPQTCRHQRQTAERPPGGPAKRKIEERDEEPERLEHRENAVRQTYVAGADRSDEMRHDAGGFVAIELIEQAARDQHARLSAGSAHGRRVDFRRIDQQQRWAQAVPRQSPSPRRYSPSWRSSWSCGFRRARVQAGDQIASLAAKGNLAQYDPDQAGGNERRNGDRGQTQQRRDGHAEIAHSVHMVQRIDERLEMRAVCRGPGSQAMSRAAQCRRENPKSGEQVQQTAAGQQQKRRHHRTQDDTDAAGDEQADTGQEPAGTATALLFVKEVASARMAPAGSVPPSNSSRSHSCRVRT